MPVEDFVAPVEIDVRHAQVVESLPAVATVGFVVGTEVPAFPELPAHEVVGRETRARIVAPAHHGADAPSVKRPHRAKEAEGLVAGVAAAPELVHRLVVAPRDRLRVVEHGRLVRNRVDRGAVPSGEARDVVRGEHDVGVLGAPVLERRALREDAPGKRAARTVNRAVGRPADHLGQSVAIEVRDHDGHVVGAGADVRPQADLPERTAGAVELHPFQPRLAGLPASRVVACVRRPPDDDELVLAVAVEVADGAVAGEVRVALPVGRHAVPWRGKLDVETAFRRIGAVAPRAAGPEHILATCDEAAHFVAVVAPVHAARVVEIRDVGNWRGIDAPPVAVDVERGIGGIGRKIPPGDTYGLRSDAVRDDAASPHLAAETLQVVGRRRTRSCASGNVSGAAQGRRDKRQEDGCCAANRHVSAESPS